MARRSPSTQRPPHPTSTPAPRKGIPSSPLAQKMVHDLQLAGLSERTQESYLRAVRKFAQWLAKCPNTASEEELRRYLLPCQSRPIFMAQIPCRTVVAVTPVDSARQTKVALTLRVRCAAPEASLA
jgi:Phage integrase, N-terminal SAM-like domain